MEWSKKQTLELIERLHAHECLWNVKSEVYKDRKLKKDAIAAIALDIEIDVNDVDKKITNLKNQFNRELNKVKTKSGSGTDEVYVSPWYAFKPLGFLKNNNIPKLARSSETIHSQDEEHNNDESEPFIRDDYYNDNMVPDTVADTSDVSATSRKGYKRAKIGDKQTDALGIIKEARDTILKRQAKDEFDIFGEYVASELRGVSGKKNLLELKKEIQDLIYKSKLKEITEEINNTSEILEVRAPNTEDDADTYEIRDDVGNVLMTFKQ